MNMKYRKYRYINRNVYVHIAQQYCTVAVAAVHGVNVFEVFRATTALG